MVTLWQEHTDGNNHRCNCNENTIIVIPTLSTSRVDFYMWRAHSSPTFYFVSDSCEWFVIHISLVFQDMQSDWPLFVLYLEYQYTYQRYIEDKHIAWPGAEESITMLMMEQTYTLKPEIDWPPADINLSNSFGNRLSEMHHPGTYSISQEICTRFCCALLCCGYAIVHNEFTWSIFPYSSGLLCWHWGNR